MNREPTKCLGLWHKADFGKSLDKECHGCARRINYPDPLGVAVHQPPAFSDKCPERPPAAYHNYQPRFRQ